MDGQGGGFGRGGGEAARSDDELVGEACAGTVAPMATGKVDIVFVIDHSASMREEMVQVRANVNRFAERMADAGLDYRVVFIVPKETNPRFDGICVPPPLGRGDCGDNPPRFFHLDQEVGSWNALELILSTYDGASSKRTWKEHARADATKVFVIVSDDESRMMAQDFDRSIRAKLPEGMFGTSSTRNYVVHGIVSKPSGAKAPTSATCATAAGTSIEYQRLALLTGGLIEEVCQTDYSTVLDALAQGIANKVSCELTYPKSATADPTRLFVRLTPDRGATATLTQVTDVSKCDSVEDGWYYDDPTAPSKIILCASACSAANETSGSKVEAIVGCKAPAPR